MGRQLSFISGTQQAKKDSKASQKRIIEELSEQSLFMISQSNAKNNINSMESFEAVSEWIKAAKDHGDPHISLMIIGNKCDLKDRRQVH